jgi:hypothetical protein
MQQLVQSANKYPPQSGSREEPGEAEAVAAVAAA